MVGLTAHMVVRNEPFVWYAVMSVYPYVDRILLWDTGTDQGEIREDMQELVAFDRDHAKKIDFRSVAGCIDETAWNDRNWHRLRVQNAKGYTMGVVRREMMDCTYTPWFIIVDGDEVHYDQTMLGVKKAIATASPNVVCFGLPLLWLNTPKTYFKRSISGRVFRTDLVGIQHQSPNELHVSRKTGRPLTGPESIERVNCKVKPYAHWETYLKPWRRTVDPRTVLAYRWLLPQIMLSTPEIMERFAKASK